MGARRLVAPDRLPNPNRVFLERGARCLVGGERRDVAA
jgi:hypothetical protein